MELQQGFWERFKKTPGALSTAEAMAIMRIAAQAPEGFYLEAGVHKGKSAMAAACTLKYGIFVLVDPCFNPDDPDFFGGEELVKIKQRVYGASGDYKYYRKLAVELMGRTSLEAIPLFDFLSYVFIDSGSHGGGLPMKEVKLLEDRIVEGGIIAFHDINSQFTEVTKAYEYLLDTGKYEAIPIDWEEIFAYVKEHDLESANVSWHLYPELPHPPNFVGALKRKK